MFYCHLSGRETCPYFNGYMCKPYNNMFTGGCLIAGNVTTYQFKEKHYFFHSTIGLNPDKNDEKPNGGGME
jgi:hypothetical protein